jgi:HK97 family phage major capsid protein
MLYEQSAEGGQSADTIQGANLFKMRERAARFPNSVWLAHPSTYSELIAAHVAGTNSDNFMFAPSNGQDVPDQLLGRPIFFHESAKQLGNKGDIFLFDPSSYLYIQKPIRIEPSRHVSFNTDETLFRVLLRDDGMPWSDSSLTDVQGFESSEFVTLAERA